MGSALPVAYRPFANDNPFSHSFGRHLNTLLTPERKKKKKSD